MSISPFSETCPECGATVPVVPDGPTHPYFGATPGCWALYTALLGREFANSDAGTHRLSVDAYAAQHPGASSRQAAINSVGVHLTALCLVFDKGIPVERVIRTMRDFGRGRTFEFLPLTRPDRPNPMTIVDLVDVASPEAYNARVRTWANSTWDTWLPHHDQARTWAERALE